MFIKKEKRKRLNYKHDKTHYDLTPLSDLGCRYNVLLGMRSNGKSFAVKLKILEDAINGEQFIYLRRWEVDLKEKNLVAYWEDFDIKKITWGEFDCVIAYRNDIYLGITENGKRVRKLKIGEAMALSLDEHYKSLQYPKIKNLVYEEFVTKRVYLDDEPSRLMHLVSTIFRQRAGFVWLIGNTISRISPYFSDWQLTNIPKQKIGEINIYKQMTEKNENGIEVAVQLCSSIDVENEMYFGKSAKAILTGVWEVDVYPKLPDKLTNYDTIYLMLIKHQNFSYVARVIRHKVDKYFLLYIYPSTRVVNCKRIISDEFSQNPLVTERLVELTKGDKLVSRLLKINKVVYSDNLTGTDFNQILQQKGGL